MNAQDIKNIRTFFNSRPTNTAHTDTMDTFGLNAAQECAINIVGRDYDLDPQYLATFFSDIEDGMTVEQIMVALYLT